jgi:hypothetical protein
VDSITSAIIAGLAISAGKVGVSVLVDAYQGLKDLLKQKFGADSRLVRAVSDLEEDPESKGQQAVLQEQVIKVKADQDLEILKAAQALLDKVKAQPGGAQAIQQATGSYIAQATHGSTASVNVGRREG